MRKELLLFVFCVTLCLTARGAGYTVSTLPDPKVDCADCYVSNPDGVLSASAVDYINSLSQSLKKTSDVEMAVVVIDAFDEYVYADAFSFCQDLFNTWGIGGAEHNTGVLVFMALQSRDVRIHTGGGMEGLLPDIKCDEILDYRSTYLSAGDYDEGISAICYDITNVLTTEEAQAELLLGYKPKSTEATKDLTIYLIAAILAFLLIYLFGYKKWNDKKNVNKQALINSTAPVQTASGCLTLFFPIPMLFFFLYFKRKRRNIRTEPVECEQCKTKMRRISSIDRFVYLNPKQRTETKIEAIDYDVWVCQTCGKVHTEPLEGRRYRDFSQCSVCGAMANKLTGTTILSNSTYTTHGKKKLTYTCQYCQSVTTSVITLPLLVRSSSSSSGSGSGSGRSGRGSSGGSWGGGSSFGGGAGRKF